MEPYGNHGTDSKITRAFDESIVQAERNAREQEFAFQQRNNGVSRADQEPDFEGDNVAPKPNLDALTEDDGLRGREFPVPAEETTSGSRPVARNRYVAANEKATPSRPQGQTPGDVPAGSIVPSTVDLNAVTPDLASEQG